MERVTEAVDIAIVGAGAAGLTAAIFAQQTDPDARILLLDGAPKIGAKILISGGGRCNVTHEVVAAGDFNGNRNIVARVLRTFTVEETRAWFAGLGVTLKREETGKLFPTTDRARTVVDALLRGCERVEVRTGARVVACRAGDEIEVELEEGRTIAARRVILATGGRSVPKTGSDGGGYVLARSLGHTVTKLFPALVPLILESGHWMTTLSGTSLEAELSVRSDAGRVLTRHRGSMLLTHFGLSGPVVLDVSRHWIAANGALFVNLIPGGTFESLESQLLAEAKRNPRATVASVLRGRIPERVLEVLAGGAPPIAGLPKEERRRIVRSVVEQRLPVVRDRGFDFAEVTAGGVPLSEIDPATMASRRCDGLYLCGEILDVDGRIGGFNFQWAWATGRLAGMHAARSLHS